MSYTPSKFFSIAIWFMRSVLKYQGKHLHLYMSGLENVFRDSSYYETIIILITKFKIFSSDK